MFKLDKTIVIIIYIISLIIPLIYTFFYFRKVNLKKNKSKKIKQLFINIIIMYVVIILLLISFISVNKLDVKSNVSKDPNESTTSEILTSEETTTTSEETTESTTTTITTTKKITTTTTKKATTKKTTTTTKVNNTSVDSSKYTKLPMISGEVKDKGTTSKGYKIQEVNGITYIDGYMIANKTYSLPENYNPGFSSTVTNYLNDLFADAKNNGFSLKNQSGFRSYQTQKNIYNNYVSRDGKAKADTYSARPGYSEHQTGYATDICDTKLSEDYCITSKFNTTSAAKWLSNNAWKYGFILRYVKNKTNETGYKYESWHFRYVGYDLAKTLYNNGNWITMESYFGFDSKYKE